MVHRRPDLIAPPILAAILLFVVAGGAFITHAQVSSAALSGTVTDQNGAVVPGATVTVLNLSNALRRQATTSDQGAFTVPLLPAGTYNVKVQSQGFSPLEIQNVILNVGDQRALQIQLKAGDVTATITVDSAAETVRTDGAVSTVVDRQFVEKIPLNGRSFQGLFLLTPGVTTNTPQQGALPGYSGEISVNGQRAESNRFAVDGVSANNGVYVYGYSTAGTGGGVPTSTTVGTTQSLIALDALQEFRVSSSSYSAEFGRSPGGQFSFVSKSGASSFHGSAFEYIRNDKLDANDWFNNKLQVARPAERQNDFGGTIGGPVFIPGLYKRRDKTFFFFSYEGLRLQQPLAAQLLYVPSLALRQQAPAVLQGVLNAYPLPTGATLNNGLAEYVMTASLPSHMNSTSIRVDHNFSSAWRIFFRFSDTPSDSVTRSLTYFERKRFSPKTYTFGATGVISDSLTNEFHFGYSPNIGGIVDIPFAGDGAKPFDLDGAFGVDRSVHPTAFTFVGLYFPGFTSGVTISNIDQNQRQWNVNDTLDYAFGNHHFKFGFDYLQTGSDLQRTDPYLYNLFDSAANLIANKPFASQVLRYGKSHPIYKSLGVFAQDEWRFSPRLNMSLGLRWEVAPSPTVSKGILPRVLTGSIDQPSTLALAPEGTRFYETTYNNFAPRFGIAYVLRNEPDHETVIRGGAGMFYDTAQNVRAAAFDANPGITAMKSFPNVSFPLTPAQWNIPLSDSLNPPFAVYVFGDPSSPFKLPYSIQWNFSVEQALRKGEVLSLAYVGSRGERQIAAETHVLSAINPLFSAVTVNKSNVSSDYDAFQAQFRRRLNRGLQVLASYTWSHSIDFGSSNRNIPVKRGDSDFDLRHSFNAALTYDIPSPFENGPGRAIFGHWSLDGHYFAHTAFPVTIAGATIVDPATGQQYQAGLDLIGGVNLYTHNSLFPASRQINPLAFKLPASGKVGNAPRNLVRGFGAQELDLTLRRSFSFSESVRLQLSLEAFNVFNHPNFGFMNTTFGNAQFGQATKMLNTSLGGLGAIYQSGGPRSLQGSVRLLF